MVPTMLAMHQMSASSRLQPVGAIKMISNERCARSGASNWARFQVEDG
jgi:hypothetical protein